MYAQGYPAGLPAELDLWLAMSVLGFHLAPREAYIVSWFFPLLPLLDLLPKAADVGPGAERRLSACEEQHSLFGIVLEPVQFLHQLIGHFRSKRIPGRGVVHGYNQHVIPGFGFQELVFHISHLLIFTLYCPALTSSPDRPAIPR